jgi:MoxR-like ATPase
MKKKVISSADFFSEFSGTAVAPTSLTETPSGSLLTVKELVMEKEVVEEKDEDFDKKLKAFGTSDVVDRATKPVSYKKLGKGFLVEKPVHRILMHNIKHNVNTMLLGPTGVGKTELISEIGKSLKLPVTIFDMGTMADPIMSLIGTHAISIEDGKSKSEFKASRFSEVIQKPGIVVLDELSRAAAGSNNLLFPCLDFRRELPMEYSFHDTTPIKIHPECVFIATANTGSSYTGTHKLDKALEDRFMIIAIDSLNSQACSYVLDSVYGENLKKSDRDSIVKNYFKINQEHDDFKISFRLSMRHLKNIAMLVVNGFTVYDAFFAVCTGIAGKESSETLKSIIGA